ncbi:MAG: hypothetical protein JWM59_2361 [Verrucomicrobiales bacterium]|nr:hypothetical protein [Verrucomicrobiales bacterium]
MRRGLSFPSWTTALLSLLPLSAGAVNIVIDYTYDTASLFDSTAKATLAQAASDLSTALGNTPLAALSTNSYTGTTPGASATAIWNLTFTNPSTGTTISLPAPQTSPGFPVSEIRIYAGWQNLTGSVLGTGSPGGASASLGVSYTNEAALPVAVNNLENISNTAMGRGDGPVIGAISGAFNGNTQPDVPFTLEYGAFVGSLWFDSDTNNDNVTDMPATLETAWNLGMNQPSAGQSDLYSTALHEIMHAVGFGTSDTWSTLSDPRIAGSHLASGTTGARLSDGVMQEAVMTSSVTVGTRKELTTVDLDFLGKLGYNVVPEPAAAGLLAMVGSLLLMRRRRR